MFWGRLENGGKHHYFRSLMHTSFFILGSGWMRGKIFSFSCQEQGQPMFSLILKTVSETPTWISIPFELNLSISTCVSKWKVAVLKVIYCCELDVPWFNSKFFVLLSADVIGAQWWDKTITCLSYSGNCKSFRVFRRLTKFIILCPKSL